MSSAISKNKFRDKGEIKKVTLSPPPNCTECHRPMGICKRLNSSLVGIDSTYTVSIPTYSCRHKTCSTHMKIRITPPNPYAARRMSFDYSVQTEVIFVRWQEHATYAEIIERLSDRYEIVINRTAIETILKTYEIGSAKTYRTSSIEEMKAHGGVLICVDVVEPLKGRKGVLVAYDYWTGTTLGSQRLPNGKEETYKKFLVSLKKRIAIELEIPVIGFISDALVAQRLAIEAIFPDVAHCLCHFHFYKLVLINAHKADSVIVTELRSQLRGNYDLKQYKIRKNKQTLNNSQYKPLIPFLEPLLELSHWKRKPKDPCFTGTEFAHRIQDLVQKMKYLDNKISLGKIKLPKHSVTVLKRLVLQIESALTKLTDKITQLEAIHEHLDNLKEIFGNPHENAEEGLKSLLIFCKSLKLSKNRGDIEVEFISSLVKYAETKGPLLFNYRTISGAPTTNNFQELKFKQLKHFLRRVIGHKAAKSYFLSHGEQIVYINPKNNREEIEQILRSCDQSQARLFIRANRRSMHSWVIVVHNRERWVRKMIELDDYIKNLELNPITRS